MEKKMEDGIMKKETFELDLARITVLCKQRIK